MKNKIFRENIKKTYSQILKHCTPELEGNQKVMDTYGVIETYKDWIDLANLIRTIWHLQNDDKQVIMATVETNKKVYILYQVPYQSNVDYMEAFKAHLKVSKSHNVSVGYHPVLATISLQWKIYITSGAANKDQNIESNIKAKEICLTCMFIIRADNLRYKQLNIELKNNCIMGIDRYSQDLPGVMKLLNNYIA